MAPIAVSLSNQEGREKAQDVEVFLAVEGPGTAKDKRMPPQRLMGDEVRSVPAGFSHLLAIGWHYVSIHDDAGNVLDYQGRWALLDTHFIVRDESYRVLLTITGSNFDTAFFVGSVKATRCDPPDTWRVQVIWERPFRREARPDVAAALG